MKYNQITKLTHLKVYKRRFKNPVKGNTKGSALRASHEPPGLMGAKKSSHITQSAISSNKLTTATRWVNKTLGEAWGLGARAKAGVGVVWESSDICIWGIGPLNGVKLKGKISHFMDPHEGPDAFALWRQVRSFYAFRIHFGSANCT
jgi:hypothetical protein